MTYFTYSRGRKSGGFNGNDDQRLSNTASPWTALSPVGLSTRNPLYNPTLAGAASSTTPSPPRPTSLA